MYLERKEVPSADTLNAHLARGGQVFVATCTRVVEYRKRNAGMFSNGKDGTLYVARGRSKDALSMPSVGLLVAVRLAGGGVA